MPLGGDRPIARVNLRSSLSKELKVSRSFDFQGNREGGAGSDTGKTWRYINSVSSKGHIRLLMKIFFDRILSLRTNSMVLNIGVLAFGQIAAQFINFSLMPIVTRLYSAHDIGLQGLFISSLTLFVPLATLGLHLAIVLPKEEPEAWQLFKISIGSALAFSFALECALVPLNEAWFERIGAGELTPYRHLLPAAVLFGALTAASSQYLFRKQVYAVVARLTVLHSAVLQLSRVSLGLNAPSGLTLIIAYLAAGTCAVLLHGVTLKTVRKEREEHSRFNSMALLKKYRDFTLLRLPQNLINSFSQLLPVFILAYYFGPQSSGQYSIAVAALSAPALLIGQPINDVLYPRFNVMHHGQDSLRPLLIKATLSCMALGILPYVTVAVYGEQIFSFVYGADWALAGNYGQWLAIWYFFQMANRPAVAAVPVLRLQGGLLLYELGSTGSKVLALWAGYRFFDSGIASVALFSVAGILAYVFLIIWVIVHSGVDHAKSRSGDGGT